MSAEPSGEGQDRAVPDKALADGQAPAAERPLPGALSGAAPKTPEVLQQKAGGRRHGKRRKTSPEKGAGRGKRLCWTGSIRQKLMLFAALLCVVLVALVWLLNVQLLEPMYNAKIRKELLQTANAYAEVIRSYGTIEDSTAADGLNADFYQAINNVENGNALLEGKCVDISGADGLNLLHSHRLASTCALHPVQGMFGEPGATNWNTRYTVALRALVLQEGDMSFTLHDGGTEQMVVCKNVDNRYVILVSTDLERIGQAGEVIKTQMPFVAFVALVLGMGGAFWFSRWFSRPLTEISGAAREMAAGNYKVRVQRHTGGEIGVLADDFNTMAAEVQTSAQLQRDLIANISHDLRTPLTLIKGYAETVRDLTGDDRVRRGEQLDVIIDETDRLSGLVNSVMELSKMQSGTEKPNRVTFDLAQLCDEVACRYEDVCRKSGHTLEVKAEEPCPVKADPDMMSRVVHNLLANALHHVGPDGWVAVHCAALLEDPATIRVEVCDHGEGIAPEDLPHIFDRYYRTRASAGKVGTGLGLSITKAILVSHGFAFGVDSEVGAGSAFWFTAPRAAWPEG